MKLVFESEKLDTNDLWNMIKYIKDEAILSELAKHEDEDIRERVADNINTSPEILRMLARDKDSFVRRSVITNKNTDIETLRLLANDESSYVLEMLVYCQRADEEILKTILNNCSEYEYIKDYEQICDKARERLGIEKEPKEKAYVLMYYYDSQAYDNREGDVVGVYKTYEKAKESISEKHSPLPRTQWRINGYEYATYLAYESDAWYLIYETEVK